MKNLTDSTELLHDAAVLRDRLTEDGYLYFRQLLPDSEVGPVRRAIASILKDCAWLAEGSDPEALVATEQAVGEGTTNFFGAYTAVQMLQEFHELGHHPTLVDLTERVLGEPVFCRPAHICRISPPVTQAPRTPTHQDYRLIQGAVDTLTTWIPLADAPIEVGGLRVLEGSHRLGLLPVEAAEGPGKQQADVADDDPRWRSTSYTAGDVLLFLSLTVHGAVPNNSNRLRLSVDYRYHPLAGPVAYSGTTFRPHHYPRVPDFPTLTRGWSSTRSIDTPPGLTFVDRFDGRDPDVKTPPSRFVPADVASAQQ